MVTRAVVVLGAVLVGGQIMRTLPHDQTLIFPVGSLFPDATRFSASWQPRGAKEPSGGVSLSFNSAPPLQIKQHTRVPNGDYIVTVLIEQAESSTLAHETAAPAGATPDDQAAHEIRAEGAKHDGLQTNIERRVNLAGGETLIALAVSPSVAE